MARRGLKVTVMGQANAVGPTSIEGSFASCFLSGICCPLVVLLPRCNFFIVFAAFETLQY